MIPIPIPAHVMSVLPPRPRIPVWHGIIIVLQFERGYGRLLFDILHDLVGSCSISTRVGNVRSL